MEGEGGLVIVTAFLSCAPLGGCPIFVGINELKQYRRMARAVDVCGSPDELGGG